jgi:iron-sulfur cluster assembly protein/iron-sulfur cluster insertion protein
VARRAVPRTVEGMDATTHSPAGTATAPLVVTDAAAAKLAALRETGDQVLHVAVRPGGCSGFSYEMYFDTPSGGEGITVDAGEVAVFVDATSATLLAGATLDYRDTLERSGFHIDNPNAQRTCGCGSSFS